MEISLADVASTVTAGLILWTIKESRNNRKELSRSITDVHDDLKETEAHVGSLKTWVLGHEKLDDERHQEILNQLRTR